MTSNKVISKSRYRYSTGKTTNYPGACHGPSPSVTWDIIVIIRTLIQNSQIHQNPHRVCPFNVWHKLIIENEIYSNCLPAQNRNETNTVEMDLTGSAPRLSA